MSLLEEELNKIQIQTVRYDDNSVEQYDVMDGMKGFKVNVGNVGFIELVDCMPRLAPKGRTMEYRIVQAARTSYGQGLKTVSEDIGLIRYLHRHKHTTPFEMIEFMFHVKLPIFVARQWIRHRTANVNEYSARYSIVKEQFFRPSIDSLCSQSSTNKQGRSDELVDIGTAEEFLQYLDKAESLYNDYMNMVNKGVSREIAREGLPLTTMTEMYWKCDLHNIVRFLQLRMDSHAQKEIRDYANAMFVIIRQFVPIVCGCMLKEIGSVTFNTDEIEAIKNGSYILGDSNSSKREQTEFIEKLEKLKIK